MNTESTKLPCIPEESARVQRVEVYLHDLKARLKELRYKHEAIIQDSVDLIEEIDDVSTSLMPASQKQQQNNNTVRPGSKIKQLIEEFEKTTTSTNFAVKSDISVGANNMRDILRNFECLNQSHVLKESLVLFKRAKESFEMVDNFLGNIGNKLNGKLDQVRSPNLKEKIMMFDNISKGHQFSSNENSSICLLNDKKATTAVKNNATGENNQNVKKKNQKSASSSEEGIAIDEQDSDHSDERIEKVQSFLQSSNTNNNNNKERTQNVDNFPSCNTSFKSFDTFFTAYEEQKGSNVSSSLNLTTSVMEKGYEGDCDSEFNVYQCDKKRK